MSLLSAKITKILLFFKINIMLASVPTFYIVFSFIIIKIKKI